MNKMSYLLISLLKSHISLWSLCLVLSKPNSWAVMVKCFKNTAGGTVGKLCVIIETGQEDLFAQARSKSQMSTYSV